MDLGDAISELETFVWGLDDLDSLQPSYFAIKNNES